MQWNHPRHRAAGFATEILRWPWTYKILALLADTPHLQARDIHRILATANQANDAAIGARPISRKAIGHRLVELRATGLIEHDHDRRPHYNLTPLADGLTGSLAHLNAYSLAHREELILGSRALHRMDTAAPTPKPPRRRADATRQAVQAALDCLEAPWSFGVLRVSPGAPVTGEELGRRVDASMQNNLDFADRPHMAIGRTQRVIAVRALRTAGLLARVIQPRDGLRGLVLYHASPLGLGLLDALLPVGEWGVPHDAELVGILAMHARWDDGEA